MAGIPRARRAAAPPPEPTGAARERVVSALLGAPGPLPIDDIAAGAGMPSTTVRFHLNRLVEEGFVAAARAGAAGRGRPRMLYAATDKAFSAGLQNDRLLADVLIHHLVRESDDPAGAAERAGRGWAEEVLEAGAVAPGDGADDPARLMRLLDDWGFSPVMADGPGAEDGDRRTIELCRCPFAHGVEQQPDAVCPVHRGIAAGVLERLGGAWRVVDLVPHSPPGRCSLTCRRAGR